MFRWQTFFSLKTQRKNLESLQEGKDSITITVPQKSEKMKVLPKVERQTRSFNFLTPNNLEYDLRRAQFCRCLSYYQHVFFLRLFQYIPIKDDTVPLGGVCGNNY